jgi:hypothetical protein
VLRREEVVRSLLSLSCLVPLRRRSKRARRHALGSVWGRVTALLVVVGCWVSCRLRRWTPRRGGARALQLYCTCCTSCSDLDPNAPHSRRGPACKLITLTTAKHLYGCTAVVQLSTAFFLYNRLQIRTVIFSRAADRVSDPYSYSDALDCTCCTSCSDAHTGPCVPGMAGAVRCSGRPPEFTC